MSIIKILDEITANQIAAGEVVDRPASVVKELLENSFDAGASRVMVEIKGGGMQEIKITDNGCGMDEVDSETAFQRHATSKISRLSDIENICSLGFRGEALPSIAAVSKIMLITRPPGEVSGTKLEIQGGRLLSKSPEGCPHGTAIIVRDLFYNTPARLKYVKSRTTEAGQITEVVSRLALARPEVAVRLENEGKIVFHTPGSGVVTDALAAIYSADIARNMLKLEGYEDNMTVRGMICPPSVSRSSKRHITVVINERHVRNYLMNTAIIEGYGTLLPQGRFPVALIYIILEPDMLDVNVHPSKMVVRVSGESKLFNLIKRTVLSTLRTEKVIPGYTPAVEKIDSSTGFANDGYIRQSYNGTYQERAAAIIHRPIEQAGSVHYNSLSGETMPQHLFRNNNVQDSDNGDTSPQVLFADSNTNARGEDSLLHSIYPVGFLPPTYILAGSVNGLLIIDHHAAHERILFEKFSKKLSGASIDTQILLVPVIINLGPREYQLAEENLDYLLSFGINAQSFGTGSLAIREVPAGMPQNSIESTIRDIIEFIIESGRKAPREDIIRKMAASMACREAIKSGTSSATEEAWALIEELKNTEFPYACPHGRPTMINIGERELKTRFKRT